MIRVLLVDDVLSAEDFCVDLRAVVFEVFADVDFDDEDFVLTFAVFADDDFFAAVDFAPAFEVFDDDDFAAFLIRGGAFFSDIDKSLAISDYCGSDSKTAFIFFANAFFLVSSFFGEDSFFTGMIITPICNF